MNKVKRLLCFFICCVMFLSAVSFNAFASTQTDISIHAMNVSYSDSVYLIYAVPYNMSTENSKLLVWDSSRDEYVYGTQTNEISPISQRATVLGVDCYQYIVPIPAKRMGDEVFACVYTSDGQYSEIERYSVLTYIYNKLGYTGTGTSNTKLINLLSSMLNYGAAAQLYFEYEEDDLVTTRHYQLAVDGGRLYGQGEKALYLPGESVKILADKTNESGETFAYWKNSSGEQVSTESEYTVTIGSQNETYIAVYEKAASAGLEFESNGDGTCVVIGADNCTDKDVVIPSKSPDGDKVTEIDSSVFEGMEITSISIPKSVETIGRKAFNNCNNLTDVYYGGSEEDWENVEIKAYNAPLSSASIHYAETKTEYTVVFKDYDGTPIKTEKVSSGASATAPANPARDGYIFIGWDKTFDSINADITVTAQYQQTAGATMSISSASGKAGDSVEVTISIYSNPGIAVTGLKINYDRDILTLTNVEFNGDYAQGGDLPNIKNYPITLSWSDVANHCDDGEFATLAFSINENCTAGDSSDLILLCDNAVFDLNEQPVGFNAINGKITVE